MFPIIDQLRNYNKQCFTADVVAGITLAAFSIPEALAYAGLAGMPPQTGLYACIVAPLVYVLFGTSRQLALGPTSAISILVGAVLGKFAADSQMHYVGLASSMALMVGAIAFLAYLLRLGVLMNFISESVLVGFSTGAAFYIASTQLGKLLGIHGGHGEFFERIGFLLQHIDSINFWALGLGIVAIIILCVGEQRFPKIPWPLVIVLGSIGIMNFTDPHALNIAIVGEIPLGFPKLTLPDVAFSEMKYLIQGAAAVFMLAYVEGMSMARTFAAKHKYRIDPNQELLALGFANIGIGLAQSFPVAGSFSRSLVNENAGATSTLAGGISSLLIIFVVLFMTGVFKNLPEPILAVIVLYAVRGLFKWKRLIQLSRLSLAEFATALTAFIGVLFLGILDGVIIGALLSLVLVIRKASQSNLTILGKVPGLPKFSALDENSANVPVPGALVIGVNSGIFYANSAEIKDRIVEQIENADTPIKTIILDLGITGDLDVSGAEMLSELHEELNQQGITLRLTHVQTSPRNMLDKMGITSQIGAHHFYSVPILAVADYLSKEGLNMRMCVHILPDTMNFVLRMIEERSKVVYGNERQLLISVAAKIQAIIEELRTNLHDNEDTNC
jgi:sulfate permease, SulP family